MPTSNLIYQLYFCKWKGCELSGVVARNCNYCLDDYTCRHTGEPCVAKVGLEAFAQSLAESTPPTAISPDAFQKMRDIVEKEKREAAIASIIRLVDPHYLSDTEKKNLAEMKSKNPPKDKD